jgi:phosphate transport system protein
MERHFDHELETLKERLLLMGGRAESTIHKAVQAAERRDGALAREVVADDKLIDELEIEIDERCVNLLALQQPLARDLRFITAALKITNDLERVGDHGVNIADGALQLVGHPPLAAMNDVMRLAGLATAMLREALDAFVHQDAETARRLVVRDDAVDQLHRQLFGQLMSTMIQDPTSVERAMTLVLVGRSLERVADLATNIAEEVVFIAEARVIKHHSEELKAAARPPASTPHGRQPDSEDFGRT